MKLNAGTGIRTLESGPWLRKSPHTKMQVAQSAYMMFSQVHNSFTCLELYDQPVGARHGKRDASFYIRGRCHRIFPPPSSVHPTASGETLGSAATHLIFPWWPGKICTNQWLQVDEFSKSISCQDVFTMYKRVKPWTMSPTSPVTFAKHPLGYHDKRYFSRLLNLTPVKHIGIGRLFTCQPLSDQIYNHF